MNEPFTEAMLLSLFFLGAMKIVQDRLEQLAEGYVRRCQKKHAAEGDVQRRQNKHAANALSQSSFQHSIPVENW